MKTFLVVSDRKIQDHMGEEWDDYIEVPHQPTTDVIQEWANRIRGRIRKLWNEDATSEDEPRDEGDPQEVHVYLDAASPFNAMLINLQIIMKTEEDIVVELPYNEEQDITDSETLETIAKLENR